MEHVRAKFHAFGRDVVQNDAAVGGLDNGSDQVPAPVGEVAGAVSASLIQARNNYGSRQDDEYSTHALSVMWPSSSNYVSVGAFSKWHRHSMPDMS